ncbi:MAG: hypothetical protein U1D97_05840 [Desulfuromonadales bacterium]|nr:hypothetical protein [Desulfuromonadales bacterium]
MAGLFLGIFFLAYLFLLVDWKSLRTALAQGGWATACLYLLLAVLITIVYSSPEMAVMAPAVHH